MSLKKAKTTASETIRKYLLNEKIRQWKENIPTSAFPTQVASVGVVGQHAWTVLYSCCTVLVLYCTPEVFNITPEYQLNLQLRSTF